MIETITIQEAAVQLNYKDMRSVIKWCEKNNVKVFFEEGSKRRYLIRMQFIQAQMKKFIQYLKIKYKAEWLDAFKAYTSMNITSVAEIEEREKEIFPARMNNYKPLGDHEISFLNSLTENVHLL